MLNEKEKKVVTMVEQNISHSNYFFHKVKDLKWFYPLKERGFFSPERIPISDSGDYLFWNILDYLERVSEQVIQDSQYGRELIDIIEDIVKFSRNRKRINNYHIWWYCVKILNNLSTTIIRENLSIDDQCKNGVIRYGFRSWLITWMDTSGGGDLSISDIGIKLLEKFLKDDSTIKYAETIIDVITKIRPSGKQRAYKREDASLMWQPYWILKTFSKNQQLIGQKCSVDAVFSIADKLKTAFQYKHKNHYANIEIGDEVYQIEVSRIPVEGIGVEEIEFKEGQYKCVVRQYSQEQLKGVDRQNKLLVIHNIEPEIKVEESFDFGSANKTEFVLTIKEMLPKKINWAEANKFEQKLRVLFDGLHEDYSQIWFKSLDSGGRAHETEAEEVLTIILRDVLLAKCEANRLEGMHILEVFLSDRYLFPIFNRFVLLCIDKYWDDYAGLLERFFEIVPNALEESVYEVELQDLFRNHNPVFVPAFKAKLKALIENVPEYYIEKGDKLTAYWKYMWLSPLRDNPDFSVLYEEAKQKAEPKDGQPYEPERSAIIVGSVVHKSPLSKEDILSKPTTELVKYLNDFKGADFWHGTFEGDPDKEGLADTFQAAVKEEPMRFTDEIDAFYSVDYLYLHNIFRGLKEAWNAGKEIDWERIFSFSLKYFDRDKTAILKEALQAQGEDSGEGKYIWIVEDIVDLIADGCRDDKRAFDPKYFEKAEQIFNLLLPLLKGEKHPDTQGDSLTYALNTTLGRTVMAYVSFSLRVARATKKKQENWGQKKYERFFSVGIDAYIWFGCYLRQMKYLDEQYTKGKIEFFTQQAHDNFEWQKFMEGYLSGAWVYQEIYSLMRANYAKALENKYFSESIDQRLVEHIAFGYLYYGEVLEGINVDGKDSLFWKMLSEAAGFGKKDRWLEVVGFFWSRTGRTIKKEEQDAEEKDTSEEIKSKILDFWAWTFEKQEYIEKQLGEDYHSFLGRLAELTILLDKIDEAKEKWLLLCAPHIDIHYNSNFFIEYLTKFEDEESIKRIGKIFLKALKYTTPEFREEDIELIVRRIYEKGNFSDADAICNTYGKRSRRGVHFLKPVWEEFQKKKKI